MLVTLAFAELLGRLLFPDPVRLLRDVDHWPRPRENKDINSDGLRDRREAADFSDETFNVIFLGDSFIYGLHLRSEDTLPARFEALASERHPDLELRAINFGWISSSPLLSLRRLGVLGPRYRPDLVLLLVDMTDFGDDIRYRQMLEGRRAFRLAPMAPFLTWASERMLAKVRWLTPLHEPVFGYPARRFFITESPLEESRRLTVEIRRNLEAIASFCREELGVPFHVFVAPRGYQYSDRESSRSWERDEYVPLGPYAEAPFLWFDELEREVDFGIYSLLPAFRDAAVFPTCLEDDPHWNREGVALAAEAVLRICEEEGILEGGPGRDRASFAHVAGIAIPAADGAADPHLR